VLSDLHPVASGEPLSQRRFHDCRLRRAERRNPGARVVVVKNPIPVVIVAGYLGSGKTTLLNHLLHNSGGARIGVVVNDFGSINIDSMLVAGQVDSMVSLGNGCLCCAVDVSEMDDLFARLAHPRSEIDVIVVEASGLAEPKSLIRLVLGSANPHIAYGGLVEVVDAAEFAETRERHPEIDQHLRLADLVVVNKADRVAAEQLSATVATVREIVGQVPVLATAEARIDPRLLFDPKSVPATGQLSLDQLLIDDHHHEPGEPRNHRHLHDDYDSLSFVTPTPLHPVRLLEFLEDLPVGVFRVKGFVRFAVAGEKRKFVVHNVGRHLRIRATRWVASDLRETQLVVIGTTLDVEAIRGRLDAAVHTGTVLEQQAMLGIHRYLER
jgi:G3E family GTPase